MLTHEQVPDPSKVADNWEKAILHARILIGDAEIMASDVPPDRFEALRSVYLSLNADGSEEAERLHGLLSQGGQIFMPMQENFFAYRFSMLRDKFGTSWMIIHERPAPPRA
jgi:PhnB protein